MKFTCLKKNLCEVLFPLSKAIAIKPQTQVLSGVYLSVKEDNLEIHTNNYSLGMSANIAVNAQSEGVVVPLGKKFVDVVKAMPSDAIDIYNSEEEGYLEVKSGRSKFSIPTMNAEEFPKVTHKDAECHFKIKAIVLKQLINQTVFACTTDGSHPIYTGCLFETKDDEITVVGTNMHRLAVARDKLYEKPTEQLRFVVPAEALRSIAEMLPDDEDELIDIAYTNKDVSFTIDKIFVKVRLIDGNFPEYGKVIPKSNETIVHVNVLEIREAIDRVALISKDDSNKKITFNFTNEGLQIFAETNESGRSEETVDIEIEGPERRISFNYMYIVDVLKTLKSANCRIAMNGRYDPVDIRDEDGSTNYIYVVTPVRG